MASKTTMRAVVFNEIGDSSVLHVSDTVPVPTAGPRQALVKLEWAGVNFIDTYLRSGLYPAALPHITGKEGAGVIVALGADVPAEYGLAVGDRVAVYSDGCAAEYVAAAADRLLRLPPTVPTRDGAALMTQGLTAWTLARDAHAVAPGETVLVQAAAGGTGGLLVQACKALGATVVGTTSSAAKAAVARGHGADHVVVYTEADVKAEVDRLTGGEGCHAVFSGVGQATFAADLACTRRKGTLVTFGNSSGPVEAFRPLELGARNVKLVRPRLDGYIATREEFVLRSGELLELVAQGKIRALVGGEYTLETLARAQDDLVGKRTTGKLLVKITP